MGFVKVPSPQSIPAQRTGATWGTWRCLSFMYGVSILAVSGGRTQPGSPSLVFCFRVLQVLCAVAVLITRDETVLQSLEARGHEDPVPKTPGPTSTETFLAVSGIPRLLGSMAGVGQVTLYAKPVRE
ncbi:hypothetical protein M419DRAFT_9386 [Trichoderma reesei RUT C-30]|uniref:Uncharacterized protein n=1 Tax=Hypocrea jecorina (strain ATCC 56765 / BCRC 32924 / NRRL 11460 / Rut C-30) TaxID=1344414 RepID=A0A024S845_HYPJR|nr:hypothetical protein M419DRAFT_9386 [Trichoderma reesei RUT C-30]